MFSLSYLLILLKESNQENILISVIQGEENNYLEVSHSNRTSFDENCFYYHFILEELKTYQLL